jgi:hypothetical protein
MVEGSVTSLVNVVGAIAALIAAGLWLYASLITVPDNIDTIMDELRRISRWNAYAAGAAAVAALCAGYAFFTLS